MSTDTADRSSAKRIPSEPDTTITVVAWRDHIVESHPESHPTAVNDTLVTGAHAIFERGECFAQVVVK